MAAAEIAGALAHARQAFDVAKLIYDAKDAFKDAGAKLQMAELIGKLADVKIELAELQEALSAKDREIAALKEKAHEAADVHYIAPSYWKRTLDPKKSDGPYCQRCWDADRKLVRQQQVGDKHSAHLHCAACNAHCLDPSRPQQPYPGPQATRTDWGA